MNRLRMLILVAALLPLAGCVVYQPVPAGATMQQRYDRSWDAAAGAMSDQGLAISQDRSAGVIRGSRGAVTITARVEMRPDDRVQVTFDSTGSGTEPGLIDRVTDSYNRRMGR